MLPIFVRGPSDLKKIAALNAEGSFDVTLTHMFHFRRLRMAIENIVSLTISYLGESFVREMLVCY